MAYTKGMLINKDECTENKTPQFHCYMQYMGIANLTELGSSYTGTFPSAPRYKADYC